MDAAFAHPDPFLRLPVIIDAFPGDASGRDPAVAESMRTVAPQDHATYAPVYGDTLAADYRRQPVWPGAAIRG